VAAALEMRRRGVEKVVILDRDPQLGGATRHCSHSPFGMLEFGRVYFGAAYGLRLEHEAAKAGVDVRTGHSVVKLSDDGSVVVTSHRGLETLTGRRVMMTTGARETPRSARLIAGDRPVGVVTTGTLQSYVAFHGLMPFRRPVIVGSELVSLSAVLTCLLPRRPARGDDRNTTVRLGACPIDLVPGACRDAFHREAKIIAILGRSRVEAVSIRRNGQVETLTCDGVLLSGQFTPESSLFLQSPMGVDPGSAGPAVDQDGRSVNPFYFAGGNVLGPVETGGWAFREGRAIGATLAHDLAREPASGELVRVSFDDPIKLVVPNILRRSALPSAAFRPFSTTLPPPCPRPAASPDGRQGHLAPAGSMAARATHPRSHTIRCATAQQVHFSFREGRLNACSRCRSRNDIDPVPRRRRRRDLEHRRHSTSPTAASGARLGGTRSGELLQNIQDVLASAGPPLMRSQYSNQGEAALLGMPRPESRSPRLSSGRILDHRSAFQVQPVGGTALQGGLRASARPLLFRQQTRLADGKCYLPFPSALASGRLRFGTTDAFFLNRLCGSFVTDLATASRTGLLDLNSCTWSAEMCELHGLPMQCLPEIAAVDAGFGMFGDTPVKVSIVDQQAALYGHNCRKPATAR